MGIRVNSDIILGFTRDTWWMVNIKNPKLGVCKTMVMKSKDAEVHNMEFALRTK